MPLSDLIKIIPEKAVTGNLQDERQKFIYCNHPRQSADRLNQRQRAAQQ
jgi:hypothetical protein